MNESSLKEKGSRVAKTENELKVPCFVIKERSFGKPRYVMRIALVLWFSILV